MPGSSPAAAPARGMSRAFVDGTSWSSPNNRIRRPLAALIVAALLSALVALGATPAASQAAERPELVSVLVRDVSSAGDNATRAVHAVGGEVRERVDLVRGLVADVPRTALEQLSRAPGILSVTPNAGVELYSQRSEGAAISGASALNHVRKVTGSTVADRRGFDGSGIGVAVVDTGVAQVTGLPDVDHIDVGRGTGDGFGHGTHVAGIIGGNDQGATAENFVGVAADARVVSIRAAGNDGSTDLFTVLSSLDWVYQIGPSTGIRVLNLSLGVPAVADYRYDVLSYAVEQLWHRGIVVVVAAGNEGELSGSPITSPAHNPYVLAVGSADTLGTDSHTDDVVHAFSPRGSSSRRVDLVAPGQSLVSLRAPGSVAEAEFPAAHVGARFIKGTGTSQAAAVVSGLAADLLEQRPELTPDQVKALLVRNARSLPSADAAGQGAGMVNLLQALNASTPTNATQTHERSTGFDPATTAPARPDLPPPPPPAGEEPPCATRDLAAGPPAPPGPDGSGAECWTGGSWSGGSWSGGSWSGGSWSGDTWTYSNWTGGSWSGGSWSGDSWVGGSWSGGSWSGGSWSGGSWSGGSWSGGSWSGGSWSGGSWSGGSWSGGSWSVGTWTGGSWSGGSWSGGSWSGGSWSGGSWSGEIWDGSSWFGGSWSGGSWSGGSWSGGSWSGGSWSGGSWSGGSWSGGSWSGGSWSGGSWSGGSWSGGSWSGGSWSGGSWSGGSWSGGSWSGGSWSGGSWSGGSWSGGSWSGGSWFGGSWSGGSWSGGSWSGGSWSGGSWSGRAWTGTSWT